MSINYLNEGLDSNYYKLLNLVDLAEFFEGGYIEEFPWIFNFPYDFYKKFVYENF